MWIDCYTLPKNQGIRCEHCGTYIRNVFVFHFDDGFSLKCGVDCFNKIVKKTNLSQYGAKALKKQADRIKSFNDMREKWTRWQTPEEAEADGCFQRIEDPDKPGFWRVRTQSEFEEEKNFILNDLIPYRISEIQKETKARFKNIRMKQD